MAKLQLIAALALLLTIAASAHDEPYFKIQGRVYCDTCRAGFETSATEYIEGARVKLECKHFQSNTVAHTTEGETDKTGAYILEMKGDHEEEICEVYLVHSPLAGCNEVQEGRDHARVLLSVESGIHSTIRYANSLGFLKSEPLPICGELLRQYDLGEQA